MIDEQFEQLQRAVEQNPNANKVPICIEISADLLTPVSAYLKLSASQPCSFLLESVEAGTKIGRYSFLGVNPSKIIRCVDGYDPLEAVEREFCGVNYLKNPLCDVPDFCGGAVGYIGYECVHFFEPKTNVVDLADVLRVPNAVLMVFDEVVAFDHLHKVIKVIGNVSFCSVDQFCLAYIATYEKLVALVNLLESQSLVLPFQPIITETFQAQSNVGRAGYIEHVLKLKEHIEIGDIIQAVPSQRLARQSQLHPFNIYRELRSVNPSPYMFYLDLVDFQIVGTSPEMLCKVVDRHVTTHPIAGTRHRGKNEQEDLLIAQQLASDEKECAEHVMLVDLGRNDVNRVCDTAQMEAYMVVERYRHVMHLVSKVTGHLRPECTPFDAFRSIFPAGTVSGAPKIRAIQLVSECERERRGVYAGAVGYFGFNGNIDTAIAIRTAVCKDGVVYLQAGGGITHDSNPEAEYVETVNKLRSIVVAIDRAEKRYSK